MTDDNTFSNTVPSRLFFLKPVFYALILAAAGQLIMLQAMPVHGDDLYAEGSLTEWMQVAILGVTMLIFLWAGLKRTASRAFNAVMIGGLAAAFVREMDRAFDSYLYDGAWQVTVIFIAIVSVLMVFYATGDFRGELYRFFSLPAYGIMLSGALIVLLFARLYGQKILWQAVMGEKFMYSVKAAAEENTELVGYCLIMIAAMEWFSSCRKKGNE